MELKQAIDLFLSAKKAEGRKDTTISWYRQNLERYEKTTPTPWASASSIRTFLAALHQPTTLYPHHPTRPPSFRTLSPATIRGYHRTLRIFFAWCLEEELIDANPMRRIKPPPRPHPLPRTLSPTAAIAIIQQSQHSARDYALVLLLADTGARDAEIRNLKISDLDLDLRRAVVTGKGTKQRWIYFGNDTTGALRTWLTVRPLSPSPYLFSGQETQPLQKGAIYQLLRRLARRAHIAGHFNPHAFRHHFATHFLESGGDIETLRELLGHESISTTQIYVHLRASALQRLHDEHTPLNELKDALIRQSK